jgi:hypothetical protein
LLEQRLETAVRCFDQSDSHPQKPILYFLTLNF